MTYREEILAILQTQSSLTLREMIHLSGKELAKSCYFIAAMKRLLNENKVVMIKNPCYAGKYIDHVYFLRQE